MFSNTDGTVDSHNRDGDDESYTSTAAPLANNVVLHQSPDTAVESCSLHFTKERGMGE